MSLERYWAGWPVGVPENAEEIAQAIVDRGCSSKSSWRVAEELGCSEGFAAWVADAVAKEKREARATCQASAQEMRVQQAARYLAQPRPGWRKS